jgi:riboflavin kinase/FMN adenylyltransferase
MLPYMRQFTGTSHRGDGRGRSLGFPTANIVVDEPLDRPGDGVYACLVQLNTDPPQLMAVMHVGPRPTFDANATVEIYILDFPDQDLYGQHFTVTPQYKLRDIAKFTTTEKLITAIQQDCQNARELLQSNS